MEIINPRLTRGEYWLLTTVVELAIPICWLDWNNVEEALNKPSHGMDRFLLIETLEKLFSEELIIAQRFNQWDEKLVLSSEQIEIALDEKHNKKEHYYRLTARGGKCWEAFAHPDWNCYISADYELPEEKTFELGELICKTKQHLEMYFRSLSTYDYEVELESIKRDIVKPWNATYWKKLSKGHRIRFKCKYREKDFNKPDPMNQEWFDSLWCYWK